MNAVPSEALGMRMARLERSSRRARRGLVGWLLLVVAMFLAWCGVGGIVQREIRVHRIYAVEDAGTARDHVGKKMPLRRGLAMQRQVGTASGTVFVGGSPCCRVQS